MMTTACAFMVGFVLVSGAAAAASPGAETAAPASATAPSASSEQAPPDVAKPPGGARRLPSGVVTKIVARGQGTSRSGDNDCVKLSYTIWKTDGSLVATTRRRSEPEQDCLAKLAPGVVQVLKMMVVGERRRAWVPANLTIVGDGDEGPPPSDETIDVELLEIVKAPPAPSDLGSAPASAVKMSSGLALRVLKRGTGTEHPGPNSRVKVDFSGWTTNGRLIESSVMARHPAIFEMSGVIPGWREALLGMATGEKVRIWIPAALAYGPKPRRGQPKGDLVYELELLSIDR